MDWKLEDYTGTNKGYLRITCDGERVADVFPYAAGADPAKVTERAAEMVATLNGLPSPTDREKQLYDALQLTVDYIGDGCPDDTYAHVMSEARAAMALLS